MKRDLCREKKLAICPNLSKQELFKKYLRKIASGENTSQGLSRDESANALRLILQSDATAAQIGAFMIAHRIRRPEAQELAGMLDTYHDLGPRLLSLPNQRRPLCFGMPLDGRTKTSPIYPLTAIILLSAGQPVVLHGGQRMPVKYGITAAELFTAIGLNLTGLTNKTVQDGFSKSGFALIHQPDHFALADTLISYRDEIGKRPPIASLELIWTAHQGKHLLITGFVHPPTEERAWKALQIIGEKDFATVKGLEGSTDLPISRPCITARIENQKTTRFILHPRDHGCHGKDIVWTDLDGWQKNALEALNGKGPLMQPLCWNAGIYLWFAGITKSLEEGLIKAKLQITSGLAQKSLNKLISWSQNYASL